MEFLLNQNELAAKLEVTYGVEPSAPAGGDFFRQTSSHVGIVHNQSSQANDQEKDGASASVFTEFLGRVSSNVSIATDLIPSGNASTPTPPDVDQLFEALMGSKAANTAHGTIVSATTTALTLTAGDVAAMGLAVNHMIAVDVSALYGLEVRQVIGIVGEVVTVDRALSAAPAAARTVKGGITYRFDHTVLKSLYLWLFGSGTGYRNAVPGVGLNDLTVGISFADDVPKASLAFAGMGKGEITHAQTRPTPTFAGTPLAPVIGKVWLGATPGCLIASNLHVNNGIELRNNESCSLEPTGLRRVGNNGRYLVEHSLDFVLRDTNLSLYEAGKIHTAIDAIVQFGNTAGKMFAYRLPNWKPRSERYEQDAEVGLRLAGRAYAVAGNDEVTIAFL
jgi:hypothetical protein